MDDIFVTGLSTEQDNPIDINNITSAVSSQIEAAAKPRNRKERRALRKRLGKKGREQQDIITDTARKLNYIDLIQRLRKMNEEKENEEDETTEN